MLYGSYVASNILSASILGVAESHPHHGPLASLLCDPGILDHGTMDIQDGAPQI